MVTICLQCGDKGFSNAFVYCVNCLKFAVHRYCLDELPDTFDEFVYWVCDDCDVETRKLPVLESKTTKFDGRDHTNVKDLEEQRNVVASKGGKKFRKGKRALLSHQKPMPRLEGRGSELSEVAELPISSSSSTKLKRKDSFGMRATGTDNGVKSAEMNGELESNKTCIRAQNLSVTGEYKENQKKANNLATHTQKKDGRKCLEVGQQAPAQLENSSGFTIVEHARPMVETIWRGGFIILNKDYDVFDGLVAHLSIKVGPKVYEEARMFPALLDLEMHPKADVWPKSFQKSEPSDDHIALYFFPLDHRYGELFDLLVKDMMDGELALKATVKNAELLVFTSSELPIKYWKFHGKYYLWGVFRAKQAAAS